MYLGKSSWTILGIKVLDSPLAMEGSAMGRKNRPLVQQWSEQWIDRSVLSVQLWVRKNRADY